ncbi:hypothetical protein [Photobacterium leiognathi]|nr:hypothetical protein [Photobacterium leiognathi]
MNQIRNALSHGEDGTGQAYYIAEICSSQVALETGLRNGPQLHSQCT